MAIDKMKLPGASVAEDLHDARIAAIETTVNSNANPVTAAAVKAVTDTKAEILRTGEVSGSTVTNTEGEYVRCDGITDTDSGMIYGIHGGWMETADDLPDTQVLVTKKYVDDAIAAALARL